MRDQLFALLIHNHAETFEPLQQALQKLSVETYSAANCQEAGSLIRQRQPHLIFADVKLWEESWTRMLNLSENADAPLNVIVVGAAPDCRAYLSAMDRGAFDFVAPPFELAPMDFVVRSAASDVRIRREALAAASVV